MNDSTALHYRYNFVYILALLILTIIGLVTVQWGAIPELAKLIAFGLTLSSLVLSLIAIVYTIFSNFSFSRSTTDLRDASSLISRATNTLADAAENLDKKYSKLPVLIEGVEKKVTEGQKELLERLPVAAKTAVVPGEAPLPSKAVDSFLEVASYTGLYALQACKLAKDAKVPINVDKLPQGDTKYMAGFLIACSPLRFA